MQQHRMRHEEDEDELKSQLVVAERERDRALDELREIRKRMNNNEEIKIKDQCIESLKSEVEKSKKLEVELTEKDASLHMMKEELSSLKSSISRTESLLSDSKKRVEELEAEVSKRKQSEEKSKLELTSLSEKIQELEEENRGKNEANREMIERLQNELQSNEIGVLKNELKRAMEAEETSKKAMDDLALALKEVATESNLVKEKLKSAEEQLEAVKEEAANLKKMVKSSEETYENLLNETRKERDQLKNTVDRLRLEAEESLLAWNVKEIEFVKCIKKAEDEKNTVQEETDKLNESLKEAERMSNQSKEENRKLRDILKQALNEANVAKEAASLARAENSTLKDSLAEKDKALVTLAQETERLRVNEAEANESLKGFKHLILRSGSKKESAKLDKDNKEPKKTVKKDPETDDNNNDNKEPRERRRLSTTFSFDLNQLWPSIPSLTAKTNNDPEKDDSLVDSIFDLVESPEEESLPPYHKRTSSACTDDGKSLNLENFEEAAHFDDMEIDRTSHGKRKALLRRFGDLLKRKNSHPPKELHHSPKEVPHPQKEITV